MGRGDFGARHCRRFTSPRWGEVASEARGWGGSGIPGRDGDSVTAVRPKTTTERHPWPELPYPAWRDTCATLQLWTQIVGKIRLAQTPWLNHSWQVTLYVGARGLTTTPIYAGTRAVEIAFDFIDHVLRIETSDGARR